jgi:hypothetical protein
MSEAGKKTVRLGNRTFLKLDTVLLTWGWAAVQGNVGENTHNAGISGDQKNGV